MVVDMSNTRTTTDEIVAVSRRRHWEAKAAALAEGRSEPRAQKFRPAKGKGSYRRKSKHGKGWA